MKINPAFAAKVDVKTVIAARLVKKAISGDLTAISMLRDTIGEKPTDKQEVCFNPVIIKDDI